MSEGPNPVPPPDDDDPFLKADCAAARRAWVARWRDEPVGRADVIAAYAHAEGCEICQEYLHRDSLLAEARQHLAECARLLGELEEAMYGTPLTV